MLKIGITGGIGSGKTLVSQIFSILGVPVFYADDVAKNIVDSDPDVRAAIMKYFGKDIYIKNYKINKKALSKIVFTDKHSLDRLNNIVHPVVQKKFNIWMTGNKNSKYIIKEAAIIFESNTYKELDGIICVAAPVELRIQRVIRRDKITKEEVIKRISNQIDENTRIQKSDYIINNDGKSLILPQILKLHNQFNKN